jgi:transcription initiation factor TFIID subunit 11
MTTPYASFLAADGAQTQHDQAQTASGARGRPRGTTVGAKRGRKPRGTVVAGASSPRPFLTPIAPSGGTVSPSTSTPASFSTATTQNLNTQYSRAHWALPAAGETTSGTTVSTGTPLVNTTTGGDTVTSSPSTHSTVPVIDPALVGVTAMSSVPGTPRLESSIFNPSRGLSQLPSTTVRLGPVAVEEEIEGDDEMLPAMADDDYSAQLSWQSQSKDNLKYVFIFFLQHSHRCIKYSSH